MYSDGDVGADKGRNCCCLMFLLVSNLVYNPMCLIFIPLQAMAMAFPLLALHTSW